MWNKNLFSVSKLLRNFFSNNLQRNFPLRSIIEVKFFLFEFCKKAIETKSIKQHQNPSCTIKTGTKMIGDNQNDIAALQN